MSRILLEGIESRAFVGELQILSGIIFPSSSQCDSPWPWRKTGEGKVLPSNSWKLSRRKPLVIRGPSENWRREWQPSIFQQGTKFVRKIVSGDLWGLFRRYHRTLQVAVHDLSASRQFRWRAIRLRFCLTKTRDISYQLGIPRNKCKEEFSTVYVSLKYFQLAVNRPPGKREPVLE